jgi:hypothetical protein
MRAVRSVLSAAAGAVLLACACTPAALDPTGPPMTGGHPMRGGNAGSGGDRGDGGSAGSTGDDLVGALKTLTPVRQMIVGTNGGVVISADDRTIGVFTDRDPEALTEAAAVVGFAVCSIEPQALAFSSATSNDNGLSTPDAEAFCAADDLAEMMIRLGQLKTPSLVVVIAANTAITVHSTNNGINFFYGDDMNRLLRTARRLYVPVCNVAPDVLSLSTPSGGQSAGLSVEQALARCGRM